MPAKAFASPFPVPPTPSWRELASNVYAKFASYLLRDLATRLQGGADGVGRRAQTSVSPPWPATRTPGPGTARGCPGDGCVAVATHPPQGWTRRWRLTPPAGVEPRDCHTGTAALRGLETERKRDETERSPATATPGDSRFTGALMVRDEAFDVAKEEWLR